MKILKLLSICFALSLCLTACDDDDNEVPGEGNAVNVPQVAVAFDKEEMTVLKNAGEIQIPVVLAQAAEGPVRLTIAVKEQTDNTAAEGIDFDLKEKVITIAKGNTIGYVSLTLYDNNKADTDKSFALEIKNVYDYGKAADTKQNCTVHIVSNAFAEFQYANRETYEAAGTYQIPLIITGEIKTATTLTVRVKEGGTALEGTHFTIPNTQITIAPGATSANIEIALVDDKDANNDRWFDLEITEIQGSNAIIGSQKICRITIISEEVAKSVAFEKTAYFVQEGQDISIPVFLDKAPAVGEEKVQVTVSIKSTSTAIEGTDFTIENKVIEFVPGQKMENIVIHAIENTIIDADRSFELFIKAAAGANLSIPDACTVTIQNNDFPVFAQETYTVEEDFGEWTIPVTLSQAPTTDITLNIACNTLDESAIEGAHFTYNPEVVIKAGETTGNIVLNIGYQLEWLGIPTFTVSPVGINGSSWTIATPQTTVQLTQCSYRKLVGNWMFTCDSPSEVKSPTATIITPNQFKKSYTCQTNFVGNETYTWHMNYNEATEAITVVLNEEMGDSQGAALILWSSQQQNSLPTNWQGDNTLKINTDDFLCVAKVGFSWLGGWYQTNIRLERNE